MESSLRSDFMLDPQVHYLNHGSFGACPRPVFEVYQAWQARLERQPVLLLDREFRQEMEAARHALGAFLGVPGDDLVFFSNPTTAINMVVRSLDLQPGDEVLTSDHEYGAMDRTWRFITGQRGGRYIHQPIPLPVTTPEEFIEQLWAGVTSQTKVIFLSHLTSQTALIFPVAEICRRARQAGILTIIDGAHAPGHIPLDLVEVGADIYTGACHKWLCGPKGTAFLYASSAVQPWLMPLVVSWGYASENPSGSQYVDYHEWQGTRDLSGFLTVPAAIEYVRDPGFQAAQAECRRTLRAWLTRLHDLTGQAPICPQSGEWLGQMAAIPLPPGTDTLQLKFRLYDEFKVEVPVYEWQGRPFVRLSLQVYNSSADLEAFEQGLTAILK